MCVYIYISIYALSTLRQCLTKIVFSTNLEEDLEVHYKDLKQVDWRYKSRLKNLVRLSTSEWGSCHVNKNVKAIIPIKGLSATSCKDCFIPSSSGISRAPQYFFVVFLLQHQTECITLVNGDNIFRLDNNNLCPVDIAKGNLPRCHL